MTVLSALSMVGCAGLASLVGAAGDPTTPAGAVVSVWSLWLPWLPWALAGANALIGVWQAFRARRARQGAVAIAQAVETAQATPVKELVASSYPTSTSLGAWIDNMVSRYVDVKPE